MRYPETRNAEIVGIIKTQGRKKHVNETVNRWADESLRFSLDPSIVFTGDALLGDRPGRVQ